MALFGKKTRDAAADAAAVKPFLVAFKTEAGEIVVQLQPSELTSPAHGGIILVDIMRHMARAMSQYGSARSEAEATAIMLDLFRAEVENPTDLGSGSIVN